MSHAITAMTRVLREGRASTGLLYGNGGYVTKHHAAVLLRQPPTTVPTDVELNDVVAARRASLPHGQRCHERPRSVPTEFTRPRNPPPRRRNFSEKFAHPAVRAAARSISRPQCAAE